MIFASFVNSRGRLGVLGVCLCVSPFARATTVTANSNPLFGAPLATKTGSESWIFSNPTATDNINWSSGTNHADGQAFDHTIAPETKFTFKGIPPVIGGVKAYRGFSFADCSVGASGSCANTSGSGSSAVGRIDTATWTVTATGTAGPLGSYDSTASGKDPWTLSASDFIGLSGGYSLFFDAQLESATISPNGSVDFDVAYQTAAGLIDLLDVVIDATGATVFSPKVDGLSIYSLPSLGIDPSTFSGAALTPSQLQSIFQSDLAGNTLAAPITLGFLLDQLPIPTVDMGSGVLAQVSETTTANDSGIGPPVPEPSTLWLLGCGSVVLCLVRARRSLARRRYLHTRPLGIHCCP